MADQRKLAVLMRRLNHHVIRSGFTFVELMVGIVVTSIVLSALAVFTFGVGDNWQQSDSAQSTFLAASMGVDRLNQLIRSANAIDSNPISGSLTTSSTPAACTLWIDSNGDGKIQYSEIILLRFDAADQKLEKYTVSASTYSSRLMSAADFEALPNALSNPVTVVNDVAACEIVSLSATSTTMRPSLELVLQMKAGSGSTSALVYTTVSPRAPLTPK